MLLMIIFLTFPSDILSTISWSVRYCRRPWWSSGGEPKLDVGHGPRWKSTVLLRAYPLARQHCFVVIHVDPGPRARAGGRLLSLVCLVTHNITRAACGGFIRRLWLVSLSVVRSSAWRLSKPSGQVVHFTIHGGGAIFLTIIVIIAIACTCDDVVSCSCSLSGGVFGCWLLGKPVLGASKLEPVLCEGSFLPATIAIAIANTGGDVCVCGCEWWME